MTVGAIDLRADTDAYFQSVEARQAALSHGEPQRRGNVNRAWSPPPGVPLTEKSPSGADVLTAAAAEAANHQAERDYAELLVRSGFLTLASLQA